VPRGQRDESLRPYSRLSRPEPLLFLPRTYMHVRTIPTASLVGEVSANVWVKRVLCSQRDEFLRSYSRLSRPEPIEFLPSSSSVVLTRLSGPRSRPTTFFLRIKNVVKNSRLTLRSLYGISAKQKRKVKAVLVLN
jgi:hypothetical protein